VCIPSEDNRVGTLGSKLKDYRKDSAKRFKDSADENKVIAIGEAK